MTSRSLGASPSMLSVPRATKMSNGVCKQSPHRFQFLGLLALACSASAFEGPRAAAPVQASPVVSPYRKRKRNGTRAERPSSSCLSRPSVIAAGTAHDEDLQTSRGRINNRHRRHRTPTTRSIDKHKRTIVLVSLPPKTDDAPAIVRRAWTWKDIALGDGRDYFVPRPRALKTLNKLLVGTTIRLGCGHRDERKEGIGEDGRDRKYTVEECGVLSNCARLDFVLVVVQACPSMNSEDAVGAGRRAVAEALASQMISFGTIHQRNAAMDGLASFLDLAGVVDECPPSIEESAEVVDFASEFDALLVTLEGGSVCRHLCEVATGLAARPSRPGREVPFRPWSSRDAHVMLQLKRTSEVVRGPRVKQLFDASLQAGKAARDPTRLPEIIPLKQYGTDGRYATSAPTHLTEAAVAAATKIAIVPAVKRCEAKLMAMDSSDAISGLRSRVEEVLQGAGLSSELDKDVGLVVRRLLHRPIMTLREGKSVDEDQIISGICIELGIEHSSCS